MVNKWSNKVEIEGAGPPWRDPRQNSAYNRAANVQNGWMATQLVTKRYDLGSLGVPGSASTPLGPGPQGPKTLIFLRFFQWLEPETLISLGFLRVDPKLGPHFPTKSAKLVVMYSLFGLPEILKVIKTINQK